MTGRRAAVALVVAALAGCTSPADPASLVLLNGNIVTVDAALPRARAVAVRGDRIVAVGSDASVRRFVGPSTEVIDLEGQTAVPGLIEGHGHFMGLGQARLAIDLLDAGSFDDVVGAVAAAVTSARPGDWILGRGWHQEKWAEIPTPNVGGFPLHDAVSAVSPENPVLLVHASGHASLVNARAMELAGITADTPNPAGGEIVRDRRGRPVGILRETAMGLAGRALETWRAARTPDEREAEARRQFDLATETALASGITSFQDAGSSFETVAFYRQEVAERREGVRLWVMVRDSNARLREQLASARIVGATDHHLTVAAIKVTADGALGSRGAWFLEPYADAHGTTGLNTVSMTSLAETAAIALAHDVQLAVHAIGDRANREVLDVYETAFRAHPDRRDRRWRIEHAQHLHPDDIPRFGRLGVIASMQAIHATSDAPYVIARLGVERAAAGAYVWQALMRSGAIVSNGTDVPVERIDPLANFHAGVTRRVNDGTVFFGEQKMSREEALRSLTWNAAFAAREEHIKGSLAVGKLADVTVLSQDILTVPDDQILDTRVTKTIVGGRVLYPRERVTERPRLVGPPLPTASAVRR